MRTRISYVDFQSIERAGQEGALMVRIAIAVNNFMSSDYLYSESYKLRAEQKTNDFGIKLGMLLIAVQIGYLYEAMLLVHNPNDRTEPTLETAKSLQRYINALSPESQKYYQKVRALIDDPIQRADFERYVGQFRNRIAFHYDTGHRGRAPRETPVTSKALKRLAKSGKPGKWVRPERIPGAPQRDTRRFEFADKVMDTAVCREIWGIGDEHTGKALLVEADKIVDWIFGYTKAFVGFASELCGHYFADKCV